MNIPTYLLGAIIFLIGQTTGAIWWASGLSAEVERLAGVQGNQHTSQIEALEKDAQMCQIEIHNLQKLIADQSEIEDAVKGLDVLAFKVEELRKEISSLRDVDKGIMSQHEKIFQWMANANPAQTKGNPYD